MKLQKDELKVFYDAHDGIDAELEQDLSSVIEKHGYTWYGQGIEVLTVIRDIAFAKETK